MLDLFLWTFSSFLNVWLLDFGEVKIKLVYLSIFQLLYVCYNSVIEHIFIHVVIPNLNVVNKNSVLVFPDVFMYICIHFNEFML